MSVIDENRMKLLKMKEKLISLNGGDLVAVEEYKEIASQIDMELYTSITDMINDHQDYVNYSLEKQLDFLIQLEEEFNRYYIFQRNIIIKSNRYSIQGLDLSDSSSIRIDEISKRIRSIRKFLENEKIIEKNKIELEKLNNELIEEDKKTYEFQERIALLDAELRQNTLEAEGRDSNIKYVSIKDEAKELGIDLKLAFNDSQIIDDKISELEPELKEAKEKLKSAQLCYKKNPSDGYKTEYYNIRQETIRIRYRLAFLKIIQLICSSECSYERANKKRLDLNELIKSRISLLEQLGIKYLFDPFDRIGINKQLELVKVYGKNISKIEKTKRKIEEIINDNDKRASENKNFIEYFKVNIELYGQEEVPTYVEDIEDVSSMPYPDNRVMSVKELSYKFKLDRVHEKTYEVIKRVYDVMMKNQERDLSYDINPSLVIEGAADRIDNDELFVDEEPFEDLTTNSLGEVKDSEDIFEEVLPFEEAGTTNNITADLFQEVNPFNEPELFDDRYDDGTVFLDSGTVDTTSNTLNQNNSNTVESSTQATEMPDVFWETSNEPVVEEDNNVVSFDDQIAALINSDGAKTKTLVS